MTKNFKVVVVGGGVAGLALANMFEQLSVDYVLLEGREEIAPAKGAGIVILPNGARILDQLGIQGRLDRSDDTRLDYAAIFADGKNMLELNDGISSVWEKRCGWRINMRDRKMLLQVMYDNLRDKSKVFVDKKVVALSQSKGGVMVQTTDGSMYDGDIVVGADGIYSVVRKEMWRIAGEESPGYFPKDELSRIKIAYRTIHGIAPPRPGFPSDGYRYTWAQGRSFLVIGGPAGRIYWFIFDRLPEPLSLATCPRYTIEEAKDIVRKYSDDLVGPNLTFGDLYESTGNWGITPLAEGVFEKWHYGRIMTLGDAAHKTNPIIGHGGNGAIESAAALVNSLMDKLDESSTGELSDAEVADAFRRTQETRHTRAELFVQTSHEEQSVNAMETPLVKVIGRVLVPLLSRDGLVAKATKILDGAVRIDKLPMPNRPHLTPFIDELPAKPLPNTPAWLAMIVTTLAMLGLSYVAQRAIGVNQLVESFRGSPFQQTYTGLTAVDTTLGILVRHFTPVVAGEDQTWRLQAMYFIFMVPAPVLIWTMEANRRGHRQSLWGFLLMLPVVPLSVMQMLTIAKVAPVYYLVTLFVTTDPIYSRTSGRNVQPAIAKALLPALMAGCVVPTILMFIPFRNKVVWQSFIALWQITPVISGPLTTLLAFRIRRAENSTDEAAKKKREDPFNLGEFDNTDLPYLNKAYRAVFCFTAAVHIFALAHGLATPAVSLKRAFVDLYPFFHEQPAPDAKQQTYALFQWDLTIFTLATLAWCLYSVFELRRLGYVTTRKALVAGAAVLLSVLGLGPGAMYVGLWWWRENVIAGLSNAVARVIPEKGSLKANGTAGK